MSGPPVALRRFEPADVPALHALYDRLVAPAPGWTAGEAPVHWGADDPERRAAGLVALRGDALVGGVSVVRVPPWLHVFPLVAADEGAAAALLDAALVHAAGPGIERIRIGVRAGEGAKRAAVAARGFARSIDMIDTVRAVAIPRRAAAPLTAELRRVAAAELDRDALRALHDLTFAEVPNSGPITDAELAGLLDGPDAWPAATAAWADAAGRYLGFVIGVRAADGRGRFGRVEAIGVDAAVRGHGLARRMLDDLLAQAEADGLDEVRAMIASTNAASLGLHRRAGFVELDRREMWDRPAGAATAG